jgi:ATP-dependent Clp protease ATP-binding subunit ClpA
MFERFTRSTKLVVLDAVREAEGEVGPEHLMLGLLRETARSAPILAEAGLDRGVLRAEFAAARRRGGLSGAEAEALGRMGIDVGAVVEQVERVHGENALAGVSRGPRFWSKHVRFGREAKAVLVGTLRQARERGEREIGDEHVLLALAGGGGVCGEVLAGRGLSYGEVRRRLSGRSLGR